MTDLIQSAPPTLPAWLNPAVLDPQLAAEARALVQEALDLAPQIVAVARQLDRFLVTVSNATAEMPEPVRNAVEDAIGFALVWDVAAEFRNLFNPGEHFRGAQTVLLDKAAANLAALAEQDQEGAR